MPARKLGLFTGTGSFGLRERARASRTASPAAAQDLTAEGVLLSGPKVGMALMTSARANGGSGALKMGYHELVLFDRTEPAAGPACALGAHLTPEPEYLMMRA